MKTNNPAAVPFATLIAGALLLALTAPAAQAKKYIPITFSKAAFMSKCRAAGGNPVDNGGGVVNCFLPNGTLIKCDFLLELCENVGGRPVPGGLKSLLGLPAAGSVNPDSGSNQPKDSGGSSTVGGWNSGDGGPVVK